MKKTAYRVWYAIAMFLSGLVLLLSVVGIAGVWIAERALANTVVQVLDAVGNVTGSLRQATEGFDQKLERMQAASTFISTASDRLSQNVTDQGLILLLLPEEGEANLVSLSSSVKETVSPLRDMLSTGLVIYRSIDQLPFVNLPAPSQEQVDKIETSVAEIQSAVDNLQTEIIAFRSGISDRISNVEAAADLVTSRLGQLRDRLATLDARLAIVQENLVQLQTTMVRVLVIVSFLITLMLAWVIYSQVEVLRLYGQRWKASGSKTRIEPPPDPTAGTKDKTSIETVSAAPESLDVTQKKD
jgi:hypothetical protein